MKIAIDFVVFLDVAPLHINYFGMLLNQEPGKVLKARIRRVIGMSLTAYCN